MATFLSVMSAFAAVLGAAPLFGRAPVIVRPRVNAAVLALAASAELLVQVLTWTTGGGGSSNPFGTYAMLALVTSAVVLRGVDVHGVRDEVLTDVVDDLEAYLRGGDATTSWGSRAASPVLGRPRPRHGHRGLFPTPTFRAATDDP